MGDLRSGNGGTPDDNGSHSHEPLPDFPPDWGPVIIPDDASELDSDRQALLRERRRQIRGNRLRAMVGRPAMPTGPGTQQHGVPLLIMAVAVLITLVSLFVVTWVRGPANLGPPSGTIRRPDPSSTANDLANVSLTDTVGAPVRLGSVLPAIVLLVDGCVCAPLIHQLANAAPQGVTVVPVAHTVPAGAEVAPNVRPLGDPTDALAARFPVTRPPGTATAVLVDRTAAITSTIGSIASADEITPAELAQLVSR